MHCVLWQQLNDEPEAPIHPSHPLPFTPTSPQLGCQSLSHLVGYRKKQHVCAYWYACITEVLRVACGPYNMLVSSGGCLHGLLLFGGSGGDEGEQGLSAAEWNALLPDTPCQPAGLMEPSCGGQAQTPGSPLICSQRLLCQMGWPPLSRLLFLSFSFSHSPMLSLSVSLAPAILLWHCVSVKTFNRRWMRNPCVKGEGGRTQRERKRGQKGHVLPPALSLHSSLPLEGHVFVCFWMRDVWNVSYVRNEQHGHKYERCNTDRHTPLTLCSAQK